MKLHFHLTIDASYKPCSVMEGVKNGVLRESFVPLEHMVCRSSDHKLLQPDPRMVIRKKDMLEAMHHHPLF